MSEKYEFHDGNRCIITRKITNSMKNFKVISVALIATTVSLISCGFGPQGTTTGNTNANNAALETGVGVLGALLGGTTGNTTGDLTTSLLTGVIGSLVNNAQSGSIVGTWVYAEPSVEFTSQNLLAQAGGLVAANQIVNKLSPYYEKVGIKPGTFTMTFNQDNTCIITVAGKTQQANYTYDQTAHTLRITGQVIGLSFGTAYATVSSNQMSVTLDSSKLLDVAKNVTSKSQNSTMNALSSIASTFNGMKTGFKFVKK